MLFVKCRASSLLSESCHGVSISHGLPTPMKKKGGGGGKKEGVGAAGENKRTGQNRGRRATRRLDKPNS